jgi:hypothetical protein
VCVRERNEGGMREESGGKHVLYGSTSRSSARGTATKAKPSATQPHERQRPRHTYLKHAQCQPRRPAHIAQQPLQLPATLPLHEQRVLHRLPHQEGQRAVEDDVEGLALGEEQHLELPPRGEESQPVHHHGVPPVGVAAHVHGRGRGRDGQTGGGVWPSSLLLLGHLRLLVVLLLVVLLLAVEHAERRQIRTRARPWRLQQRRLPVPNAGEHLFCWVGVCVCVDGCVWCIPMSPTDGKAA